MDKLKLWWNCTLMGNHNWTSAAEQGIKATQRQIDGGVDGFHDYAKMYCTDCGEMSKLNDRRY